MTLIMICRVLGHSLLCSLALLTRSAALIHSLDRSLTHSGAQGKVVHVSVLNASISCSFSPLCSLPFLASTSPDQQTQSTEPGSMMRAHRSRPFTTPRRWPLSRTALFVCSHVSGLLRLNFSHPGISRHVGRRSRGVPSLMKSRIRFVLKHFSSYNFLSMLASDIGSSIKSCPIKLKTRCKKK